MHHTELAGHLHLMSKPSPLERCGEIVWAIPSMRGEKKYSNLAKVYRLLSDYGVRCTEVLKDLPTDVRPLSVAERILALLRFHESVFTAAFVQRVEEIIASSTPLDECNISHSPLILRQMPELDEGLTKFYHLREIRRHWGVQPSKWETQRYTDHHLVEESIGGAYSPKNIAPLPREMYHILHFFTDTFPPHVTLFLVLCWTYLDNRNFSHDPHIWNGMLDLFWNMGKSGTDIAEIYQRGTLIKQNSKLLSYHGKSKDLRDAISKQKGLAVLRESMRLGHNW